MVHVTVCTSLLQRHFCLLQRGWRVVLPAGEQVWVHVRMPSAKSGQVKRLRGAEPIDSACVSSLVFLGQCFCPLKFKK